MPTGLAAGAAASTTGTSGAAALGEDLGAAEGSPAAITCTSPLGLDPNCTKHREGMFDQSQTA